MMGPAQGGRRSPHGTQGGECRVNDALVLTPPITARPAIPARGNPHRRDHRGGFLLLFLGWAAFVPLDAGVHAAGTIAVAGNRQTVQHKDGGVVTAIHVREGQHVRAGEVLIELSAPELKAAERALTSDYLTLLAQRARLLAERTGQRDFAPPPEFATLSAGGPARSPSEVMQLQRSEMHARSGSISAQQSVLGQRAEQLVQQQSGYTQQRAALIEQQRLIDEELDGLRKIAEKGFASMNRVRELERAAGRAEGSAGSMEARICARRRGHRRNQDAVAERRRASGSSRSNPISRTRRASFPRRCPSSWRRASSWNIRRFARRRPGKSSVFTVFTVGGVVAPGQKLMDIVPTARELIIQAQLKPTDADDAYPGAEGAGPLPQRPQSLAAAVHGHGADGLGRQLHRRKDRPILFPGGDRRSRSRSSTACARCSARASFGPVFPSRRC